MWRWRPDRTSRRAQNLGAVVAVVKDTACRVQASVGNGEATLVLGGDCTVGIGTVAGHMSSGERVGLIYFDAHADLNVPASVPEGALDWMGLAHMLDEPGAAPELVHAGERVPLLSADQVLLFGWDPVQATDHEREAIERLGLSRIAVEEVAGDPEAAGAWAADWMAQRCERVVVHFDVDVIDFTDVPLSENTGRNKGLAYEPALRALGVLLEAGRVAALTVTELNPDHAEDQGTLPRFAADLGNSLAAALASKT